MTLTATLATVLTMPRGMTQPSGGAQAGATASDFAGSFAKASEETVPGAVAITPPSSPTLDTLADTLLQSPTQSEVRQDWAATGKGLPTPLVAGATAVAWQSGLVAQPPEAQPATSPEIPAEAILAVTMPATAAARPPATPTGTVVRPAHAQRPSRSLPGPDAEVETGDDDDANEQAPNTTPDIGASQDILAAATLSTVLPVQTATPPLDTTPALDTAPASDTGSLDNVAAGVLLDGVGADPVPTYAPSGPRDKRAALPASPVQPTSQAGAALATSTAGTRASSTPPATVDNATIASAGAQSAPAPGAANRIVSERVLAAPTQSGSIQRASSGALLATADFRNGPAPMALADDAATTPVRTAPAPLRPKTGERASFQLDAGSIASAGSMPSLPFPAPSTQPTALVSTPRLSSRPAVLAVTTQMLPPATGTAATSPVVLAPQQPPSAASMPPLASLGLVPLPGAQGDTPPAVTGATETLATPTDTPATGTPRWTATGTTTPVALAMAQPEAVQPQPGMVASAAQVFGAAIQAATKTRDAEKTGALDTAALSAAVAPAPSIAIATAQQAPLDMRQERWPHAMIERIEMIRDAADAGDTRIRLIPDALGAIDVSVKSVGDTVHVHFNAEQAATRTLLADAQPRLAELAEARGLKLGQGAPGDANAGGGQQRAPTSPQTSNRMAATSALIADAAEDTRIA
jgi:flagellar hook-length control protein FliK